MGVGTGRSRTTTFSTYVVECEGAGTRVTAGVASARGGLVKAVEAASDAAAGWGGLAMAPTAPSGTAPAPCGWLESGDSPMASPCECKLNCKTSDEVDRSAWGGAATGTV